MSASSAASPTRPKRKARSRAERASKKPAKSLSKNAKQAPAKARVESGKVLCAPAKKARKAAKRASRFSADGADKYELYQLAVQSADTDVAFHRRVFKSLRGREPLHFREDFCGTGLLSSTWIQQSKQHTAEGFDIDPEPVAWGLAHNFDPLGADARRYTVHLKDVRSKSDRTPDVRVAQNFSYYCMLERKELLEYFTAARQDLAEDGIFVIDLYGGGESSDVMEETVRCKGFVYVWEQASFFPGTGDYVCHIHFRFPDGTELRRAFTYNWRQWYLTELYDLLIDAGFAKVTRYFEGTAKDGVSGNGVFRAGVRGENCPSWVAYLVATK
jgi:hypothetical protein